MAASVSVIVLNWNGERFIGETISHLLKTRYSPLEIIVVDNHSSDNSLAILKSFPEITIIQNQENLGFAEGNNVGIRRAGGKYIALVNNDLKVEPDWLDPLIEFLENNPDYAAVQPKILSWANPTMFEYAGGVGGFIDRYGYPFTRGRIMHYVEEDRGQYDTICDVFWVSGACMVVRKSVVDEVGLMDKDFFLHQEEIDWCWRMQLAGYKLAAIPWSNAYHFGGGSLNYDHPFKLYLNYRNNLTMLLKNMDLFRLLSVLPIRIILDFGAFFHNIVQGKMGNAFSIVRGYFAVLWRIFRIMQKRKRIRQMVRKQDGRVNEDLVYPHSIILSYYLGRKTFSSLRFYQKEVRKI